MGMVLFNNLDVRFRKFNQLRCDLLISKKRELTFITKQSKIEKQPIPVSFRIPSFVALLIGAER